MNYFNSPQEAVSVITELLQSKDWETLTSYYDLEELNIDKDKLLSGEYFVEKNQPEASHPAGFWRHKHPFAPGFEYSHHEEAKRDIIKVWLKIEIDEGNNETKIGVDSFLLIKKENGYQIVYE